MRATLLKGAATALALLLVTVGALWAAGPRVAAALDGDAYHLLLLGSDADPFHGVGSSDRGTVALNGRADAIHLVSVSPDRQQVSIVSLPRDTTANVPGFGRTKINAGLVKGPENMVAAVEGYTGVDIDDWAVTSFSGLVRAIDDVGGVTVHVDQRLHDPYGSSSDLQPGEQTLDGWDALTFARDRYSRGNGDVGRSTAQAQVLLALRDQYVDGASLSELGTLLRILNETVATSISPRRAIVLASIAAGLDAEQITHVQLTGGNNGAVFEQLRANGVASGG